jgi:ribosomal protein S18 acetylase RimI-like enzyme
MTVSSTTFKTFARGVGLWHAMASATDGQLATPPSAATTTAPLSLTQDPTPTNHESSDDEERRETNRHRDARAVAGWGGMSDSLSINDALPDDPAALSALADYWRDIVGRYYGRTATDQDVVEALADFPSDDLAAPTGVFMLARDGETVVGCAGLRWSGADEAELTRVWVCGTARRRGVARQLLAGAEERSRVRGRRGLWLEVRSDLVEAHRLYRACGFTQTTPFSDGRLAEAVFSKDLT